MPGHLCFHLRGHKKGLIWKRLDKKTKTHFYQTSVATNNLGGLLSGCSGRSKVSKI